MRNIMTVSAKTVFEQHEHAMTIPMPTEQQLVIGADAAWTIDT